MSFVSLLLAFLLEQIRPLTSGHGLEKVFHAWADWLKHNLDAGDHRHAWMAWGLAVGIPCVLAAVLHAWLWHALGWLFAMGWNLAVLYATLGFRRFSHHFTGIRDALAVGDDVLARQLLREWQGQGDEAMSRSDIVRHLLVCSALAAHRHVFGVVSWFLLLAALGLGPMGALLFRLSALLALHWQSQTTEENLPASVSPSLHEASQLAWHRVNWLPARLTGLTFAVVGNFEDAVDAWRQQAHLFPDPNDGVVLAATAGAINVRLGGEEVIAALPPEAIHAASSPMPASGAEPAFSHVRSMVGLVWRAVVMWMLLLALLTLARWSG
mgnify:CR=1 FL=1